MDINQSSPYRIVSFTKNNIEYNAQVWPISPGSTYKARVIILQNHGEDIELYKRLIEALSNAGYESFFYSRMLTYQSNDEIRREMNRVVKMCTDDIDEHTEIAIHKIHMLGQFIAASKALNYGIDGHFRHRLKSIIAINPYIKSSSKHLVKSASALIKSKLSPKAIMDHLIEVEISDLTSDEYWLDFLKEGQYKYNDLCAKEVSKIFSTSDTLLTKSSLANFTVRNVLLIHSAQDRLSNNKSIQFVAENIAAESVELLEYKEGKNNLILEKQEVFVTLLDDLIIWLDNN